MRKENPMKKILWIAAYCALSGPLFLSGPACAESPRGADRGSRMKPAVAAKADAQVKSGSAASTAKHAASASAPATSAAAGGPVNLNEASAEQIERLPGIGPSRAGAILAYRKAHPFKRVEELMRVKGFGKKTFARLRPMLSVSAARAQGT
jgi:competence ComEA-like helix-hairpin-helix protein